MPFGDEGIEVGVGLALSGGGFRATLFHCGALLRLNEFGYLPKLDRVSSVSGGSIAAGLLATRWRSLRFSDGVADNLDQEVVSPLQVFCRRLVDIPAIIKGLLVPGMRASDFVRREYELRLFGDATLQDLPERPRFVFDSTNLSTGVNFRFSRPYAGDYRIGLIDQPRFAVAQAVAASSAFPPFLSPVVLKVDPGSYRKTRGADLHDRVEYRRRLVLTDGGAYDNLGLETVWNRYRTVLTSDAGAPFGTREMRCTWWFGQLLRVVGIATNQARGLRKRALIADYQEHLRDPSRGRAGAYWGIGTKIEDYKLPDALPVPASATRELAAIRTRLNPFSDSEQGRLINWGYAICDAAMRRYVLRPGDLTIEPRWPRPEVPLTDDSGKGGAIV